MVAGTGVVAPEVKGTESTRVLLVDLMYRVHPLRRASFAPWQHLLGWEWGGVH